MLEVNGSYITADIEDIIKELKTELAINGVQYFYKSLDTPHNYMVCCPFHKQGQERKPSMGILKSDGTCHCFACGWVGSLAEMISNCFGYNDFGAFGNRWLIKNFLTIKVEDREDIDLNLTRKTVSKKMTYVSEEELDKYRYYHPYWTKRGITDERIIELFDLGYDKETQSITMPVRDYKGNTLFVARRSVQTKFFNYPQGVEKPLYGIYELYKDSSEGIANSSTHILGYPYSFPKEVIVCESMIDALTCWQYGKYAVALNGLGTQLQFKQLRALPCRKLILATDNDKAGMSARENIAKNVKNKILTQYIIPKGKKDINDLEESEFNSLKEIFV